jgi:hypothetical protein
MKTLILLLPLLLACGDNITPDVPEDDGTYVPPMGEATDGENELGPDAGVIPDAALPICDDKHPELNNHEHKCQHGK